MAYLLLRIGSDSSKRKNLNFHEAIHFGQFMDLLVVTAPTKPALSFCLRHHLYKQDLASFWAAGPICLCTCLSANSGGVRDGKGRGGSHGGNREGQGREAMGAVRRDRLWGLALDF